MMMMESVVLVVEEAVAVEDLVDVVEEVLEVEVARESLTGSLEMPGLASSPRRREEEAAKETGETLRMMSRLRVRSLPTPLLRKLLPRRVVRPRKMELLLTRSQSLRNPRP